LCRERAVADDSSTRFRENCQDEDKRYTSEDSKEPKDRSPPEILGEKPTDLWPRQ